MQRTNEQQRRRALTAISIMATLSAVLFAAAQPHGEASVAAFGALVMIAGGFVLIAATSP